MKKILIAFGLLLIIFITCIYIFIPSTINASAVVKMSAPVNGVYRCVSNEVLWNKWLDKQNNSIRKKIVAGNSFANAVSILVYYKNDTLSTIMSLLPLRNDSTAVQWKFEIPSGINPFAKISNYNKAVRVKKSMDSILQQLKQFVSKDENIYGFAVKESSTKDTLLISTKTNLTYYPNTNDIYTLIDKLKNYATGSNTKITGYPMYNVTKMQGDTIRLMVALPVDKELKQAGLIAPVKMVPGRFLTAQITGGNETIKNALAQMQLYFAEHNRTAMAITFNYLITDRRMQPDTAKWITKIYAPVY